jgi:tetratricopeptide (TPR) repeat protein
VLEGSVRTSGANLRITAQLIDARSDTHIWSESYDRELGDILAVQEDVASRIVAELEPALLGDVPQAQQIAADTYYRYLRGKFHLETGEVAQAITTLKKVVEEEPRFADGWAQLALAYFYSSPSRLLRDHSNDPNWDKLLATTEKVAEIDPDHPAVLIGDAWLAIERRRDYEFAAGNLELAVERYSDPEMVLRPAAHFATMIGRGDLALKFLRLAQDRDPLCGVCVYQFANTLMQFGQYGKAEQAILDWAALVNADGGGELTLGKARLLAGDLDSAEAAFDRRQDPPGRLYGQLAMRIARGENGGVQQDIAAFAGLNSYLGPIAVAELYAMSGNDDAAFEWLRKIADVNVSWVLATDLKSPFLAGLGDDPRWVELQEIAGIAPRQLEGLDFDPRITWSEDR